MSPGSAFTQRNANQLSETTRRSKPRRSPKISVIIACYNSSQFLDEAVDSILTQSWSDLELILIDDCSKDDTLAIANRYRIRDDRVSVLSLPVNSGPGI